MGVLMKGWMKKGAWLGRALAAAVLVTALLPAAVRAQEPAAQEYRLGPGDGLKIAVFQNPDLSLETRVSETGAISYPLVGTVQLGGLSMAAAERAIADGLKKGGFVLQPCFVQPRRCHRRTAGIGQGQQHLHQGDAIGIAMMDARNHGAAALVAFDQMELPKWFGGV